MTDTFGRDALRDTPSRALRRPLYDPSVDASVEECVPYVPKARYTAPAAEPTDPSIFRFCAGKASADAEAGSIELAETFESAMFDEPTLEPELPPRGRPVVQPSAMRGMMLALGLLGGGAAVAAALLVALAAVLGVILVASEGGPSITSEATQLPASSPSTP